MKVNKAKIKPVYSIRDRDFVAQHSIYANSYGEEFMLKGIYYLFRFQLISLVNYSIHTTAVLQFICCFLLGNNENDFNGSDLFFYI